MSSAEMLLDAASLTPSLSQLLAVDSVSSVLAYLVQGAIIDDPDARLQALSEVLAHVSTSPKSDSAVSANGVGADGTSPSSATYTRVHGARWKWADVVMRGVTDPWSRIRSLAAPVMADLLDAEVELVLQRHDSSFSTYLRSSSSTPRSSSVARTTPRSAKKDWKDELTATESSLLESVSAPLEYVWHRWRGMSLWYEQDGIVRMLAKLYSRSGTPSGDALRTDEAGLRCLLFNVIFPALRNPQLPVRESAALLLGILADRRSSTSLSPAITSFVVDHVCRTIMQVPTPARRHSPETLVSVEDTRVLEGNLLALNKLVDADAIRVEDADVMPLLLRLSNYPASSVRQYVAQILRPPSLCVFTYLMQRLCEHQNCMPQHAEGDGDSSSSVPGGGENDDSDGLSWQRLETLMMALQQHLLYLHTTSATMQDLFHVSSDTKGILTPVVFATSLSVVFQATHSPRFEVARMGLQLFPLLLQLSLRFCPPVALPRVCEACCGSDGCVQAELNRIAACGAVETLAKAQTYVATFVVPVMWWFLTIRRLVAEVREKMTPSPTTGAPGETRAQVEDLVRPYATLEQILFASQAHLSGKASSSAALPRHTATCALLPLVTYFATVMDPEEWHRCVNELLAPSWWAGLLADPARQEQARVGPDFVRAVHRRGTSDEVRRVVELVPTLTAALADAPTHQQCLLVAMIRVAVVAHTARTVVVEEHALSFLYHEAYAAPALVEGGDAVSLGHVWLKHFMPTQEAIPAAALWGESSQSRDGSIVLVESNSTVFQAIEKRCYQELYQSPQTEPVVLRELRSLMMSLSHPSMSVPSGEHVYWYAAALAAVFGRLEKVCPQWRETDTAATAAATAVFSGCEDDNECWDDWDDEEDGAAQGIYAAEEVRNARAVVLVLRERAAAWMEARDMAAAEHRFRPEFAVLTAL
ncbi:hypothetical protein, conserved [Leishmania donovani]|uniref:Uncharacterized protein n=1 Tax=Leishmania donovani TaxID=5661 RepID=A0A3Q8IHB1_LEIDO|nr:hypothetical protein, conserved [Leishmania donovani]AYU83619.1 hypothetical protein LdCL_360032900 [Leishmania donovani]TPP48377.1 hypothetical protein CGC21_13635 [Leishmania donovani]CBZ38707.1 hypothetical protein, conserved [Leishmania donovani]